MFAANNRPLCSHISPALHRACSKYGRLFGSLFIGSGASGARKRDADHLCAHRGAVMAGTKFVSARSALGERFMEKETRNDGY